MRSDRNTSNTNEPSQVFIMYFATSPIRRTQSEPLALNRRHHKRSFFFACFCWFFPLTNSLGILLPVLWPWWWLCVFGCYWQVTFITTVCVYDSNTGSSDRVSAFAVFICIFIFYYIRTYIHLSKSSVMVKCYRIAHHTHVYIFQHTMFTICDIRRTPNELTTPTEKQAQKTANIKCILTIPFQWLDIDGLIGL